MTPTEQSFEDRHKDLSRALVISSLQRDREILKASLLMLRNLQSVHTVSPQGAIEQELTHNRIGLVVIDSNEDADLAFTMLRRVRDHQDLKDIPVLVVFQSGTSMVERRLKQQALVALVEKPYTPQTLQASIERLTPSSTVGAGSNAPDNSPFAQFGILPLFKDCTPKELATAIRVGAFLNIDVGGAILSKGAPVDGIYVLLRGMAKSIPNSSRRREIVYHPGFCIGLTALLTGTNHVFDVVADSPVRLIWLPKDLLLTERSPLAGQLMRNAAHMLALGLQNALT